MATIGYQNRAHLRYHGPGMYYLTAAGYLWSAKLYHSRDITKVKFVCKLIIKPR